MYQPGQEHTLAEYWKLVEMFPQYKYEYVDGYVRMMTGGSPPHAQLQARLSYLLTAALEDSECNVYGPDAIVRVTEQRYYCPDASVSCDPADWTRQKELLSPIVVIEILSPTTEKVDKTEKLAAYQALPAIQDILLVDSHKRRVEHYHRILPHWLQKWDFAIYDQDIYVIELVSIGIHLRVRDIYRKVYLRQEESQGE